jgi:hypothetical protein
MPPDLVGFGRSWKCLGAPKGKSKATGEDAEDAEDAEGVKGEDGGDGVRSVLSVLSVLCVLCALCQPSLRPATRRSVKSSFSSSWAMRCSSSSMYVR